MKKITFLAAMALACFSFSQHADHVGPANHHFCGNNYDRDAAFEANPALKLQDDIDQAQFEIDYQHYLQNYDPYARATKIIPVVVHIVHLGGVDNISDEQVYDAIEKLNEDFSMTNPDLGNTVSQFSGITGFTDFEFRLATKDPSGNCHTGITRTYSTATVDDGSGATVAAIQAQHGNWAQNKYMNVIVCQDPNGAAGYTNNPGNWYFPNSMGGSIYMRHDYMGTIGTSNSVARHTLSHEVGHWFNLSHCWGGNNNPGAGTCNGGQDQVNDTPPTIGWTSCNVSGNTCSNDASNSGGYYSTDVIDNVQNIMEYSYCATMFTQGQAARMQSAANSSTAQRNNLWTTNNLNATGTNGNAALCEAAFSSNVTTICAGQSVDFYDESFHSVTSRTWTFDGGSPGSSSAQDPVITYSTPGIYNVSLQVSDGTTTLTEVQNNYIVVLADPGTNPPYSEGFESYTSIPNNINWMTYNETGGADWALNTTTGFESSKCVKLANFGTNDGSIDELISESIDLSGVALSDNIVFNFRHAYKRRSGSNNEKLQFYISKDCGETWALRKNISGIALGDEVLTSAYTPSSDEEWYYDEVTNINSDYYVSNFRFKFVFNNDGGNNIYIDNINLYPASMTDIVEPNKLDKLTVFPNPTNGLVNIQVTGKSGVDYNITLLNTLGQVMGTVYTGQLADGLNSFEYNTEKMAKGVYLVRIESEGNVQTVKLTKD